MRPEEEMETEAGGPAQAGMAAQEAPERTQAGWLVDAASQAQVMAPCRVSPCKAGGRAPP